MPRPKRGRQGEGGGRPSPFAGREIEIARIVAARLQTGEPLAVICRENTMPSHEAIEDWRVKYPEVETLIARARIVGFDKIAADCLAIADDTDSDDIVTDKGKTQDTEWIARSRLRVETRLKLLAKWDPKRYGDKVELAHSGEIRSTVTICEDERKELIDQRKRILTGAN